MSLRPPHLSLSMTRRCLSRRVGGFTLVELLLAVMIIAIISTLMVPAVRGLVGVGGRRGGMDTLSTAIEQARLSAMENGVAAYVGFPTSASDPELGYGSVIVVREPREDEEDDGLVAVTRWLRMPRGVYIDSAAAQETAPEGVLPKLGGDDAGALSALKFDRFGKLVPSEEVTLRVGEKTAPDGDWLGRDNNYFELTVQPLTGRVVVEDKSSEQ